MVDNRLDNEIRSAYIPPSLSWIIQNCKNIIKLSFFLPDFIKPLPKLALQFLKISNVFKNVSADVVKFVSESNQVKIIIHSSKRTKYIGLNDLEKFEIDDYITDIYLAGNNQQSVSRLISYEAFKSSVMENLHIISKYMLTINDLDMLKHIFLTGLTAGYGLGYNRAVLFVYDHNTKTLTGENAIGSLDKNEAEKIWEIIESQDLNIEDFIKRYIDGERFIDSSLKDVLAGSEIKLSKLKIQDEIKISLKKNEISVFSKPVTNKILSTLNLGDEFLLMPLRTHNKLWGIVFMDNAFNKRKVFDDLISMTELFVNQTSFIWGNFYMLQHFKKEAREDGLTGVANRTEFESILDYLFSIEKPDLRFFMVIMDIDNFKTINDNKGHAFGDRVLVKCSEILKSVVRGNDFVARYGGDEFLMIIRDVSKKKMLEIAKRLQGKIRAKLQETISLGISCFPGNSRSRIELFKMADDALYQAKNKGKDRIVFYQKDKSK